MLRALVVGIGMACAAFGQSAGGAGAPLSFEVASVKPVEPRLDGRYMIRLRVDAGRLNYSAVSLKSLIQAAYDVQGFQISGPEWMASTRFDIVATFPAGVPRSKVPEMLRALLTERFQLAVHRETRELPGYALVVGKSDAKMKVAEPDPTAPATASAPGAAAVPAGWYLNKGPGHLEAHGVNMASLVKNLSALLGSPVTDQTGLSGNYDFDLSYTPEEMQRTPSPPGTPSGNESPGAAGSPIPAIDPNGPSLLSAIQSQLGLKLETRKGPVEHIVIDRVEKSPIEN